LAGEALSPPARAALGEAASQAAYHRGLDLPAADAVAYALQQPPK